jgi:CHAT domain-containing protein
MIYLFDENQLKSILNRMANFRGIQVLEQPATLEKSKELFDLIWKPIDPLLQNVKTVFFAPEGLLTKVSFASLIYPNGKFLFDKYQLQNLFSTKSIATGKSEFLFSKDMNATIYGGIHYFTELANQIKATKQYQGKKISNSTFVDNVNSNDYSRGGEWVYLKGTLTEVEQISQIMEQNKIKMSLLSGVNGVEESFKALSGRSPSIIHIATHGFYINNESKDTDASAGSKNVQNPMFRSGLIMAGANRVWTGKSIPDGLDDGILTAYEVSMLDLSNTKLVVLSACETGLGDIKGSEGVYGLQRAFKMAGVKYILMTLWEIRDEVTVEFMTTFYKQWLKGKDIHEAFKFAQDEMRKKYEANYWAAFVLVE